MNEAQFRIIRSNKPREASTGMFAVRKTGFIEKVMFRMQSDGEVYYDGDLSKYVIIGTPVALQIKNIKLKVARAFGLNEDDIIVKEDADVYM